MAAASSEGFLPPSYMQGVVDLFAYEAHSLGALGLASCRSRCRAASGPRPTDASAPWPQLGLSLAPEAVCLGTWSLSLRDKSSGAYRTRRAEVYVVIELN